MNQNLDEQVADVIIMGAGTCGLATAAFAAQRSSRVWLLDAAPTIGGTLLVGFGQLSAAGTRLQAEKRIVDSPEKHFEEALRISRGTIDRDLSRLAIFNAGSTFDWLMDHGYAVLPQCPAIESAHEPYDVARYYWGADRGLTILNALEPEVRRQEASGRIRVLTSTRVVSLLQGQDGVVRGVVVVDANGVERSLQARNVVLASGGYAANAEMFRRLCGHRLYVKAAYEYAQGMGLELGVAAGGYLRGREHYLSNFGWLLDDGPFPSPVIGRVNTYPDARPPWEIYVNSSARRFIREDEPSVDVREHALLDQPELRYWIVFDQAIFDQAPPMIYGWSREQMAAAFNQKQVLRRADSLQQLATDIGLDPVALINTVSAYNAVRASGKDPLGRQFMPAEIGTPPYYAIRQQGGSVTSTVGLAVDSKLQVVRPDGSPIAGLYAGGEILGSGQLQGNAFVGGMMAMPAIVFGRLLGEKFLEL